MRPVHGRVRLPEELIGRRVEGGVELRETRVAHEDSAVRELDLLRKPLERGDEGDRAVAVVDRRADALELLRYEEQDRLAGRRRREGLVQMELVFERVVGEYLDVVHAADNARAVDPAQVVRERLTERAVKLINQWRGGRARRHQGQEERREEPTQGKQLAPHARTPFLPPGGRSVSQRARTMNRLDALAWPSWPFRSKYRGTNRPEHTRLPQRSETFPGDRALS